jgi:HEAT repeat protein
MLIAMLTEATQPPLAFEDPLSDEATRRDQWWYAWRVAAMGLASLGPAAEGALPVLRLVLAERLDDPELGMDVAEALWRIGRRADDVVPGVVAMMEKYAESYEPWFSGLLGEIGPGARGAVPALRRLLQSPDGRVRRSATRALRRIEGSA